LKPRRRAAVNPRWATDDLSAADFCLAGIGARGIELNVRPGRRALELLASCRYGCTESIMIGAGLSIDMMVELVRSGLATATAERVVARRHTIEVTGVRITEAGRRAPAFQWYQSED
jgi:hypothetical protein